MKENNPCVYILENNINGKVYVGQTKNFPARISQHMVAGSIIGRALRKYGIDNFTSITYPISCKKSRDFFEKGLIKQYNAIDKDCGYNICKGGEGFTGTHSEETKIKLSNLFKGIPKSREAVEKSILTRKNQPHAHWMVTEQRTCKTCGNVFVVSIYSDKQYCSHECYGNSMKGKPGRTHTEEEKEKLSNAIKGHPGYKVANKKYQTCPVCNKTFAVFPSEVRKYCSQECYSGIRNEALNRIERKGTKLSPEVIAQRTATRRAKYNGNYSRS